MLPVSTVRPSRHLLQGDHAVGHARHRSNWRLRRIARLERLPGPLIYLQVEERYTLAIGLNFFRSAHDIQYNLLLAASTLMVLPVIAIFFFFQRALVEGITLGSIK